MNKASIDTFELVNKAYDSIRDEIPFVPKVGLVLGSGLGNYAENIKVVKEIKYSSIEGFPTSTVSGHDGKYIFGYVNEVPVVCMKGRVHYYEGYSIHEVVMPIRLMKLFGISILFLTNAAGGMGDGFKAGDLMMITDQISIFAPNPLIGPNIDELGTRFPDMSNIYNAKLCDVIRESANELGIELKEGVYTMVTGPSYESPSDVRFLKMIGSGAVGMSTVPEAIAANHMGIKVCGVSCITNMAAGINEKPLSHEEVKEAGNLVADKMTKLVTLSITRF